MLSVRSVWKSSVRFSGFVVVQANVHVRAVPSSIGSTNHVKNLRCWTGSKVHRPGGFSPTMWPTDAALRVSLARCFVRSRRVTCTAGDAKYLVKSLVDILATSFVNITNLHAAQFFVGSIRLEPCLHHRRMSRTTVTLEGKSVQHGT